MWHLRGAAFAIWPAETNHVQADIDESAKAIKPRLTKEVASVYYRLLSLLASGSYTILYLIVSR